MAEELVLSSSVTTKTFSLGSAEHQLRIVGTYEDTGMPDGVDILHCRHTSDSRLAEQIIHHTLKGYRYDNNREWFQGDPEPFAHITVHFTKTGQVPL